MIKRLIIASTIAILLTTQSQATPVLGEQFCGDRYCGQYKEYIPPTFFKLKINKRVVKTLKLKARSPKQEKASPIPEKPIPLTSGLAAEAKKYLGMTARQIGVRRTLWCSAFLRKLTNASGVDDRAISWLKKRVVEPAVNTIAVMKHHVGIVIGFKAGNPILISGNHGHKVGIGVYSKHKVLAYVST